jgi:hypothetical protein
MRAAPKRPGDTLIPSAAFTNVTVCLHSALRLYYPRSALSSRLCSLNYDRNSEKLKPYKAKFCAIFIQELREFAILLTCSIIKF